MIKMEEIQPRLVNTWGGEGNNQVVDKFNSVNGRGYQLVSDPRNDILPSRTGWIPAPTATFPMEVAPAREDRSSKTGIDPASYTQPEQ